MENQIRRIIREVLSEIKDKSMFLIRENSNISTELRYHIENRIGLCESVFRYSSDKHIDLINEARQLYNSGEIQLSEDDVFIVSTDAGERAMYNNKEVFLDLPFIDYESIDESSEYENKKVTLNKPFRTPGESKKFAVYVKNKNGEVIKVRFGDPNLRVKNYDPEAARSFRARHRCSEKTDKTTPGWWSCNIGRYADLLGLVSKNVW